MRPAPCRPAPLCLFLVVSCCLVGARAEEDAPVAYWAFEGRSEDTAIDATGNEHVLVLSGTTRGRGAIGQGAYFAGGASSASTPLTADLQCPPALTVQAWVRPDELRQDVEGAGVVYAGNYLIRITRGTPSFHVFTTGWKPILAEGKFMAGQWHCLVGTYDGTEMRIYVNGKLAGAVSRQGSIPASRRPLVLGRQASPFVGGIDEVKIYRRCLAEDEVQAAYDADLEKRESGGVWVSPHVGRKDALVPPPALAAFFATPLPEGPVPRGGKSILAVRGGIAASAAPALAQERSVIFPAWSLAENLGCPWLHVWPLPSDLAGWRALHEILDEQQGEGPNIALPLPMHAVAMERVWERLRPHEKAATAVVVRNGASDSPRASLASWRLYGDHADWAIGCARAKKLASADTMVMLARLPLLGPEACHELKEAAEAVRGIADGICVYTSAHGPPESELEPALRHAQTVAQVAGLQLWLDAEGWEEAPTALRCAYFLRLLGICQETRIRLVWWPDSGLNSAFIDADAFPTPLHDAAHIWQRLIGKGANIRSETTGSTRKLFWSGEANASYVAWWRPGNDVGDVGEAHITLPEDTVIVDPLHGQVLNLSPGTPPPLCAWPLVACPPLAALEH